MQEAAINLNTGHVKSYGAEIEVHLRLTDNWRIDGGAAYLQARITDDSEYFAITGVHVSSDRIIFTPDYNFNINTNYRVPIGSQALVFDAGIYGKAAGSRGSCRWSTRWARPGRRTILPR